VACNDARPPSRTGGDGGGNELPRFKPHQLQPGAPPARLVQELNDIQQEIARDLGLLGRRVPVSAIQIADYACKYREVVRLSPPAAGARLILPEPVRAQADARVVAIVEGDTGPLSVEAVNGTVNGQQVLEFGSGFGFVEFVCDGTSGWWTFSPELTGAAPSDAEFVLAAADPSIPNGRVATSSGEIAALIAAPGVISWALNVASVAFSKLANLTGLSVLGRAASTTGVMAAITATSTRQVLRYDGTSLAWGFPVRVFANGGADGIADDIHSIGFVEGGATTITVAGGSGAGTVTISSTDTTYSAGDGIDLTGTVFSADVSDFAGTGLEDDGSNNLRIAAAAAGAGLTGGADSALAVGAGTHITVNANDVAVDTTSLLGAIDSTSIVVSGGTLQRAAVSGDITIAQNSNTAAITAGVIVDADVNAAAAIAGTKLGALTGFADKASGSAATTSAEPIVTFSASANMSNERVLTSGTNTTVDVSIANQIRINSTNTTYSASSPITLAGTTFDFDESANFAWTGAHNFGGLFRLTGEYADSSLASNQNDLAIGAVGVARFITTGGSPPYTITGMVAQGGGQIVWIENADSGDRMTLAHESTSSTTVNRFVISGNRDLVLLPRTGVWARYDGTSSRWFLSHARELLDVQEDGPTTVGTYEPTLGAGTNIYRVNPSSVDITFTGFSFAEGNRGKSFLLVKQGGDGRVIIKHNSGVSSGNGAFTPGEQDYILSAANQSCIVWYQTSASRYNIVGTQSINGSNPGTSGQVLTSQGSSSPPIWSTAATDLASTSIVASGTTLQRAALTGDVTSAQNSNTTTIANDAVTNAKAANMAQGTIKGRALGAGTGDPTDLSAAQVADIVAPSLASTSISASSGTLIVADRAITPAKMAFDYFFQEEFLSADSAFLSASNHVGKYHWEQMNPDDGTFLGITSAASHAGVVKITCTIDANNRVSAGGAGSGILPQFDMADVAHLRFVCRITNETGSVELSAARYGIGLVASLADAEVDSDTPNMGGTGLVLLKPQAATSTTWLVRDENATSGTADDTGVTAVVDSWVDITLTNFGSGNWSYVINGVAGSTSGVPTSGLVFPGFWISSTAAGNKGFAVDLFEVGLRFSGNRF
jgi:hypothetical protein